MYSLMMLTLPEKSPLHSLEKIYLPFSVVGRTAASKNSCKLYVRMILVHNPNGKKTCYVISVSSRQKSLSSLWTIGQLNHAREKSLSALNS